MLDKEKLFADVGQSLGGTCFTCVADTMAFYLNEQGCTNVDPESLLEEFAEWQETHEQYECDNCGWMTYPGESCGCQDEEERCPDCECEQYECECE